MHFGGHWGLWRAVDEEGGILDFAMAPVRNGGVSTQQTAPRAQQEIRAHTCEVKTDERPFISGDVRGSIREGVCWTRESWGVEDFNKGCFKADDVRLVVGNRNGQEKKTESLGRERFLSMRSLAIRSLATSLPHPHQAPISGG